MRRELAKSRAYLRVVVKLAFVPLALSGGEAHLVLTWLLNMEKPYLHYILACIQSMLGLSG